MDSPPRVGARVQGASCRHLSACRPEPEGRS